MAVGLVEIGATQAVGAWENERVDGAVRDDLVLRPAPAVRVLAALIVATGVALPFLTQLKVQAALSGLGLIALGFAGLRVGVRVGSSGVVLNGGFRTRRIPWSDVEGFRVKDGSSGGVCVLVADGEVKQLPYEALTLTGAKVRRAGSVPSLRSCGLPTKVDGLHGGSAEAAPSCRSSSLGAPVVS